MHNILQFLLLSAVEHAILSFQMRGNNGGRRMKPVLYTFVDYFYGLNKAMIRYLGVFFETHCFFFCCCCFCFVLFCFLDKISLNSILQLPNFHAILPHSFYFRFTNFKFNYGHPAYASI